MESKMKEVYKILSVDKERDEWLRGLKPGDFVVVETQEANFVSFISSLQWGNYVVAGHYFGQVDGFMSDIEKGYIRQADPNTLSTAIGIHLNAFKAAIARYDTPDTPAKVRADYKNEAWRKYWLATLEVGHGVRIFDTPPELINKDTAFVVRIVVGVSGDTIYTEHSSFSKVTGHALPDGVYLSYLMPMMESDAPILKKALSDLRHRYKSVVRQGEEAQCLLDALDKKGV